MREYKESEILEFNCYGSILKGHFLSKEDNVIFIKVTSDSEKVYEPGETAEISETFLINK